MDFPTEVSLRRAESAQPMKTKTTLMKERFSRWTDSHHERVLTSDSGPYAIRNGGRPAYILLPHRSTRSGIKTAAAGGRSPVS